MSLCRGVANLVIRDKRSAGYVEKLAWGQDFCMTDVVRTRRPGISCARESAEWLLDGIVPVPELNAVILEGYFSFDNMLLDSWNLETDYWKEVQPPGWPMTWLKNYDGAADSVGSVLSSLMFPQNMSWGLRFLRAQPPYEQYDPIYLALTLNALGTVQYQLYLDHAEGAYPSLWKSSDVGATWDRVSWLATSEASRWLSGAFERVAWVSCIFLPDHLLLYLDDMSEPWIYFEEGLELPQGHVRVESGGGHMAFHFAPLEFVPAGSMERACYIIPPEFLNEEAEDSVEYLGQEPDGTSIEAGMGADETGVWPWATLYSNGERTPALFEIQATRPAKHSVPITTKLFDNLDSGDKAKLIEAEFYVGQWKGSWFRARLRTTGEYDFDGDEAAQLSVARDTGGELSYVTQVTGYLECPKRTREPENPGLVMLDLTAHDRFCRLNNKAALLLPSFAGWSFGNAWTWLFHEVAGIPEAEIALDAGAFDWLFPCPLNYLAMKYDQTLSVPQIADELAAAAGRRWGVNRLGVIFTEVLGSAVYSGEPDFVLDEETVTPEDVLYFAELERDPFGCKNFVLALGADVYGNDAVAAWRWTESMSDPTSDLFIGDMWSEVIMAPDGADPAMIAQYRGTELAQYQKLIIWQTDGKPNLFPDDWVEVNISNIDIPAGTVFKILEKWGKLNGETGEFVTKFIGGVL